MFKCAKFTKVIGGALHNAPFYDTYFICKEVP